jgi:anthranilate phosphoribosyltransferase
VLAERGTAALIVRGHDGLDEVTTAGATDVWTAGEEGIRKATFDTARFGLSRAAPGDLAGGDAAYNAKVVRAVLSGEPSPARDAVLANAAAALAARNGTGSFEDASAGLDRARAAVASGDAAGLLDRWIAFACELAGPR